MTALIMKLNATGDVVRTTVLLRGLPQAEITWITADGNKELLAPLERVRCLGWTERERAIDRHYDVVINLEDEVAPAEFLRLLHYTRLVGAFLDDSGEVTYSPDLRDWFDLSLISVHGRQRADALKFLNRRTYQDLIFEGLGLTFRGEPYVLPPPVTTTLAGDVAIAPVAGPVWPMKGWAYYDRLKVELEATGLHVNVLPQRKSLLQHMADVSSHRCLVGGDSLPMHFALGTRTGCVTLFNCTSPWEIFDYGVQTKLISPLLEQFFYKRGLDEKATRAIRLEDVYDAVLQRLRAHPNSGRPRAAASAPSA